MDLTIDIDEAFLDEGEHFKFLINNNIGSWIMVKGDSTVSLYENGKLLVSVNLKQLADHLGTEK